MTGAAIALVAALVLVLALPVASASAASRPPSVPGAFGPLVRDTGHLPRGLAGKKLRRALLRSAKRARTLSKRRPCVALSRLAAYRRSLGQVRIVEPHALGKRAAHEPVHVRIVEPSIRPLRGRSIHYHPARLERY